MITKQNLETEYCNDRGDSSFNTYNNNDYTKWLEKKIIEAGRQVKDYDLLHNVSNRRELLIAFMEHLSELSMGIDDYDQKELLDDFESNL